jgi:hypothetical protein
MMVTRQTVTTVTVAVRKCANIASQSCPRKVSQGKSANIGSAFRLEMAASEMPRGRAQVILIQLWLHTDN